MVVLCFGSVNIDEVYHVPHIVESGETISSSEQYVLAGGKGANQAVAVAKAACPVKLAAKIGTDGLWVLQELRSYGVDTSLVLVDDDKRTGRAIIQVSEETHDNAIVLSPGTNFALTEENIQGIFQTNSFSSGDLLLIQHEINHLPLIIKEAHARGMLIAFNAAPIRSTVVATLPLDLVHFFIVNETEAAGFYNQIHADAAELEIQSDTIEASQTILSSICDSYPSMLGVIITLGEHGLVAKFRTGPDDEWAFFRERAVPTRVVDTTGAGDTFIGFFLAALAASVKIFHDGSVRLEKEVISGILKRASLASSLACSRAGASQSIPTLEEVLSLEADNVLDV